MISFPVFYVVVSLVVGFFLYSQSEKDECSLHFHDGRDVLTAVIMILLAAISWPFMAILFILGARW